MKFYLEEIGKVLAAVESSRRGLTRQEAAARLARDGRNRLKDPPKVTLLMRFVSQLEDPMILILLAAAAVSSVTATYAGDSFADVFIILFVVVVNAVLGVYQENKAERAIEALQQMAASTSHVLRDGEACGVKSEELVVGDVVLLEAGDAVPADARILESASLQVEEAALTGESVPVHKVMRALGLARGQQEVPLGDRTNMAYMGSTVAYGRGRAVVVATGMNTEMGRIADAIAQAQQGETPLQQRLGQLSRVLSVVVVAICAFIFGFSLLTAGELSGAVMLDTFMVAVSLAVAAIPEGLAAVVTIVLSMGVTTLSRQKAVIRRLTAVETLGCTRVICSDKTGTLTQNRMTVVEHYGSDERLLASAMALCSDAQLNTQGRAVGEPTECALVEYAVRLGLRPGELLRKQPRVGEAPFDSGRKMMSTLHQRAGRIVQYTKGAPDELLARCTHLLAEGRTAPMTGEARRAILRENQRMAGQALRVLGVAQREWTARPGNTQPEQLERELTFIGLVGMIDPVRPEVIPAIQKCRTAGIRPVMITGDHRDTAVAIARQLGILTDGGQAITGDELSRMSDAELRTNIAKYSVYARVQPEHKVRIVTAWKAKGMVTAMTGDGVNDAPSIKSADIGIGMGITGTDVTKNVADMVLLDDNFATIVLAVEEGRRIYDNIRKAIQFLLSSNLSEVLSIFAATVMGFTILKPVHILWINLITDCFPALALGMDRGDRDLMRRKPRPAGEGVFAGGLGADVAYQGVLITLVTLASYFIGHFLEAGRWEVVSSPDGMSMAFLTMSMAEIFHSLNMRSQRGSLFGLTGRNLYLIGAMVFSLFMTTVVLYVPFLSSVFQFEHISLFEYLVALALAFSVLPIVEAVKWVQRHLAA